MKLKSYYAISLLSFFITSCNSRQKNEPINSQLLIGRYCNNQYSGDSIFIYPDKSYMHKYYDKDNKVDSMKSIWNFKSQSDDIFFESFKFYPGGGPSDLSGSWPSHVFINEDGVLCLQYSEDIFYFKVDERYNGLGGNSSR